MDGTVTLTEKINFEAYKSALKTIANLDLNLNDWGEIFSGRKPLVSISEYYQKQGLIYDQILLDSILKEIKLKKDTLLKTTQIDVVKGFHQFITELIKNKFKTALVTSTVKEYVETIARNAGINSYFDTFITAEDIVKSKPDPESYITAMNRLKAKPVNTIIFEDSLSGLKAAVKTGASVIKVGEPQIKFKEVVLVIKNYDELSV